MRVEGRKFNSNFVTKYGHLTEVDYLASFLLVFDTRSRIARVRDDVPQFPDAFQVLQNAVREDKVCGHEKTCLQCADGFFVFLFGVIVQSFTGSMPPSRVNNRAPVPPPKTTLPVFISVMLKCM